MILLVLITITMGLLWYAKLVDRLRTSTIIRSIKIETVQTEESQILVKDIDQDKDSVPDQNNNLDLNLNLKPVAITFLDIGQGDATFIEWPDGTQMLIDCAKDARVLEALGRVMKFYDKEIDYLVVTHPDADHYAGCIDVLKRFKVNNIVWTGYMVPDPQWHYFLKMVDEEQADTVQIREKAVWQIAGTTLSFLYPNHDVATDATVPGFDKIADNNTSIVIKLSYGESDLLLTGDAEAPLEQYLVDAYGDTLNVQVLHVGHHGSNSSSIQPFLSTVTPAHAIISVGKENDYGHPTLRVLRRLERAGAKVWRTDERGDITARIYTNNIFIESDGSSANRGK